MIKYTPNGEAVAEKLPSKYSKSVSEGLERSELIENPPRNTPPRWFVLHKKMRGQPAFPTPFNAFDTGIVNYELTVYTITETPPNSDEAKVNFMKVMSGQIKEQNEITLSIKKARDHWRMFISKGWTELPSTDWPQWLKDNVSAYGEKVA